MKVVHLPFPWPPQRLRPFRGAGRTVGDVAAPDAVRGRLWPTRGRRVADDGADPQREGQAVAGDGTGGEGVRLGINISLG